MHNTAVALAVAGFLTTLVSWIAYLATIPRGTVPPRPVGSILAQLAGIALALAAIVIGARGAGPLDATVLAPAAMALMLGPGFLGLFSQRRTPVGELRVNVGDRLLGFSALDSNGAEFHSDTLLRHKTLLKFFRGSW